MEKYKLPNARILLTEPWEPIISRRGDALGLGAVSDQFAQAVAPDFSNRIRDGRWLTILSWCLMHSHTVFKMSGGQAILTRAQQQKRYEWLRPLELMWVARAIALGDGQRRDLSGQRSVNPWYKNYWSNHLDPGKFGMSVDQYRAYRQSGMYGRYRLAFRKWPLLTIGGDGWTPGDTTKKLATWLDGKLAERPWPIAKDEDGEGNKAKVKIKLLNNQYDKWWLKHWKQFDHKGKKADLYTLPREHNDFSLLPESEILKPIIFGKDIKGDRRRKVAVAVSKSGASDHDEICQYLSEEFPEVKAIAALPAFARLADAGADAMECIVRSFDGKPSVKLVDLAKREDAKRAASMLCKASEAWRKRDNIALRHIETVYQFANEFKNENATQCFEKLLYHHMRFGGGLHWFTLNGANIEPLSLPGGKVSRYGYRLWSLCRLAAQCGVIRTLPRSLRDDEAIDEDDVEEVEYE